MEAACYSETLLIHFVTTQSNVVTTRTCTSWFAEIHGLIAPITISVSSPRCLLSYHEGGRTDSPERWPSVYQVTRFRTTEERKLEEYFGYGPNFMFKDSQIILRLSIHIFRINLRSRKKHMCILGN
jgi:hypothetical protein